MEIEKSSATRFFVFITIWCSLLLCPAGAYSQTSGVINSDVQLDMASRIEVSGNILRLRSALLDRDSAMLSTLLADDVKYGHSNGLMQSKGEVIRSVVSGQHDYRSLTLSDEDIRIYGSTAVVNLFTDVSMVLQGKPVEMSMNILMVWIREGTGWKLVARQSVKRI